MPRIWLGKPDINLLTHMQELVQLNRDRIQQLTAAAAAEQHNVSKVDRHRNGSLLVQDSTGREGAAQLPGSVTIQQAAVSSQWSPVAFSESVADGMKVVQHAGQPWILFRDADGNCACIEDCCAHRACPLSLVGAAAAEPLLFTVRWCLNHCVL